MFYRQMNEAGKWHRTKTTTSPYRHTLRTNVARICRLLYIQNNILQSEYNEATIHILTWTMINKIRFIVVILGVVVGQCHRLPKTSGYRATRTPQNALWKM